jgi:hypothetical protein
LRLHPRQLTQRCQTRALPLRRPRLPLKAVAAPWKQLRPRRETRDVRLQ